MGMFDLIRLLSDSKIDFVLVGGLAVALQGYPRTTMDVDVVLAMDADNLSRFVEGARVAGLRPTIPVELEALRDPALIDRWYREKGMQAFSLRGQDAQATVIDVLVRPKVSFEALRRDATLIEVGACRVPVASIAHLIEMKRDTGRSKDKIDIEELEKLQGNE